MQSRFRKVAVFVGAAALATGVGVGVAAQGGDSATNSAMSQRAGGPGQGGPRGMDVSALADELGVTEAKLEAALQAARPAAGGAPQDGADTMAAALAEALGLSTDKVAAALESVMPDGGRGGAPPAGAAPPDGTTPDGAAPATTDDAVTA